MVIQGHNTMSKELQWPYFQDSEDWWNDHNPYDLCNLTMAHMKYPSYLQSSMEYPHFYMKYSIYSIHNITILCYIYIIYIYIGIYIYTHTHTYIRLVPGVQTHWAKPLQAIQTRWDACSGWRLSLNPLICGKKTLRILNFFGGIRELEFCCIRSSKFF